MSLSSQDPWNNGIVESDGEIVLPAQWDDALATICGTEGFWWEGQEYLFRRMMREEATATVYRIFKALVCEGTHSVLGRIEEPKGSAKRVDKQLYRLSEEALTFTKGWADRLGKYDLKALCKDLMEAVPYGHKLAEIEYQEFTLPKPFQGQTLIVPADIAPKPRTAYNFKVKKSNQIVGAMPRGGSDNEMVPATNLVVFTVGGMDRDPRGGGVLATIWDNTTSKARERKNQGKSGDQIGGGFLQVTQDFPPQGTELEPYVKVPDGYEEDGVTLKYKQVSRTKIAAVETAKLGTGKVAVQPPGMKAGIVQSQGGDVFGSQIDYDDRCIFRAFLGSAQMALEAKRDSQAASGKAENVGETIRDDARGGLCAAIEDAFRTVLRLNFGDKYDAVVPRYDIVTEEPNDLSAIVTAMLNPEFKALPVEIQNQIAQRGGFQEVFTEQAEPDPTEQIAQEDAAATEADVSQFIASFSDDQRANFATRTEITNGAAQRRLGGDRGIVKSSNRQFRSLVKRLADGKITNDEFASRFAYTISVGHERALNLGWSHGLGGDVLSSEAEQYFANVVLTESDFASELADALASGEKTFAQANLAAQRYAQRMGGTANEAFRLASVGQDVTFAWELGGTEDHCAECPELAGQSPFTPETLYQVPRDFSTPCRGNCLCRLVRSDGREGFSRVNF